MKTIALIAQKDGTGKTTLALSLAFAAEQEGKQAVIIDPDPQATACRWSDGSKHTTELTDASMNFPSSSLISRAPPAMCRKTGPEPVRRRRTRWARSVPRRSP